MTIEVWTRALIPVAMAGVEVQRRGHVYRGLGLWFALGGSPKGRRPPSWSLTHLGSGHAVAYIAAAEDPAFAIATEIADAGDWTFSGLHGWKNSFPDAPAIMADFASRFPKIVSKSGGGGQSEEIACRIAARAA